MYEFNQNLTVNWLSNVLKRIPDHSIQRLEELLPGNLKKNPLK
jgi:hypothetical protein